MESIKESFSIQALRNEPYQDSSENLDLDPDICSWNQKRYPIIKPFNLSTKLKPTIQRSSPKSCQKPTKKSSPDKETFTISINTLFSKTPKLNSQSRNRSISKSNIKKDKNLTPEPFFLKHSQDSPKIIKYSNYLNNLVVRKLKLKQINRMKQVDNRTMANICNYRALEMLFKNSSPYADQRKTPVLRNRLPLTTAQTLEELLKNTKVQEINKRFYKYKIH